MVIPSPSSLRLFAGNDFLDFDEEDEFLRRTFLHHVGGSICGPQIWGDSQQATDTSKAQIWIRYGFLGLGGAMRSRFRVVRRGPGCLFVRGKVWDMGNTMVSDARQL